MDKIHVLNNFIVCLNSLVNWDIFIDFSAILRSPRDLPQCGQSAIF
ncbi:MAG: hypothetical protein LBJ00_07830 [Planctomycetaceae bacterium]|nr:hypothetical protein [Planctomycetaceae bacterium]